VGQKARETGQIVQSKAREVTGVVKIKRVGRHKKRFQDCDMIDILGFEAY
jgi:hypothetical protein